jgi:hypothetical protein
LYDDSASIRFVKYLLHLFVSLFPSPLDSGESRNDGKEIPFTFNSSPSRGFVSNVILREDEDRRTRLFQRRIRILRGVYPERSARAQDDIISIFIRCPLKGRGR